MSDCSNSCCYERMFFYQRRKGTSETGNAALDNIFARKSVRTYLNKGSGERENRLDASCRNGCPFG